MPQTLAHISDLHIGRDRQTDDAAAELCAALARADVDEVLLTGDVTHRGRSGELGAFERMFATLASRLVVVPGNHDRLGPAAAALMPGRRVDVEIRRGLYVVRVDSTAPHNSRAIDSHGELGGDDLAEIERAISAAPRRTLVVLMLHHHVLPLPEDHLVERVATWLGLPNAGELERGRDLVRLCLGRCDLLLHGHRHAAAELELCSPEGRRLRVLNAGATPQTGLARVVTHEGGRVLGERLLDVRSSIDAAGASAGRASPAAA